MSVFAGGSRISSFTITVAVILIAFSILTSGVVAVYTGSFNNKFGGIGFNWDYAESYSESEYGNLTRPSWLDIEEVELTSLNPDARVQWHSDFFNNQFFQVARKGYEWFDSWYFYTITPAQTTEEQIIENRKTGEVFSKFTYDVGQNRETDVFYYPQFWVNGTDIEFIYGSLEESFDNDVISVVVGSNATYPSYDVFSIFSIVTSFETYEGLPFEVDVLIKTIFWGLLLLLIVKLFVG